MELYGIEIKKSRRGDFNIRYTQDFQKRTWNVITLSKADMYKLGSEMVKVAMEPEDVT